MEKIKHLLNKKQLDLLTTIGWTIEDREYSSDDIGDIVEDVADHLFMYGSTDQDEPNDIGNICEDIITIMTRLETY